MTDPQASAAASGAGPMTQAAAAAARAPIMRSADELIQSLPWRFRVQGVIFATCGLAYMFDAWTVLLTGFVLPLIRPVWSLNNVQLGLFGTVTYVGMAIGALISGAMADSLGRKRTYVYTIFTYSLFSLTSALAPSYQWLLFSRFIAGLGLGGTIPVVYSLVAEFMPTRIRGQALNILDAFWGIGATLNAIVATYLLRYQNWRLLFLAMLVPGLLALWAIFYLPESPSFLVRRGRLSEARDTLRRLSDRAGGPSIENLTLPSETRPSNAPRESFGSRFTKVLHYDWRLTLGLWIVVMVVFLHRNGVTMWLPSILIKEGYSHQNAFLTAGIMWPMGFIGILASSFLIDVLGRKKFLMISSLSAAVLIIIFTRVLNITGAARTAIILYGLIAEPVIATIYTFISESYPTHLRATGFGCASMIARLTIAFLVSLLFGGFLWPALGTSNAFVVVGCLVAAGMFVLHFLPETRGKALD